MEHTHKKKAYFATALQYSDETKANILSILGDDASVFGENYIIVRANKGVKTVRKGDWVVIGENKEIKIYTNNEFNTKYEGIIC